MNNVGMNNRCMVAKLIELRLLFGAFREDTKRSGLRLMVKSDPDAIGS